MIKSPKTIPIFDLHCDMLAYLAGTNDGHLGNEKDIGCAIPHLKNGNVKFQVMAVWSAVGKGSTKFADNQVEIFQLLPNDHPESFITFIDPKEIDQKLYSQKTGIVIAIENAAGLCTEDEPLHNAFERLERIHQATERIFYISLTHFGENRFSGGNASEAGLKKDGRALLDFMDRRQIAIDLAHASTQSMIDILNYTDKHD